MDPIKYIFEKPAQTGRLACWHMLLSEYDIQYVPQKAIKGSILSDYLADQPVEDYEPLKFDFPDEDILLIKRDYEEPGPEEGPEPGLWWRMMFDGSSNYSGHGIGADLMNPKGGFTPFTARLDFECTNNVAEYEACILGLEAAIDLRIKLLKVSGDSALVIYQVKGKWETKHENLIPYRAYIIELIKYFDEIKFEHVPRSENHVADALAMLASMWKVKLVNEAPLIRIERRTEPAYCQVVEENEVDEKPWFHDIKNYVLKQEYPEGASCLDKKTLRRLASRFFISNGVLYKRSYDMVLLRCVDKHEADMLLQEIHEGTFGTHANGYAMSKKMLRAGYYWLTMEFDCIQYARKCPKCQIYADKMHVPPAPLNWVEAASYANVTKQVVARFIKREIICRYGIPSRIITDNGTNLNNKTMKELCDNFKIAHHNSSPYRPKMNGAVEAANKNIKKILQKMVKTYKDWHEMLPFALHGYRTTVRTSTGATPFSLVYGMDVVLPIEVELPSLRVLREAKLDEAEWVQDRFDQLNLIDEKRLTAMCHGQLYQKWMKRAFDKKV
ncbi:uncharacterized protein LOC127079143 [Lathyrus oleraceus]|uniref:uncharacterized protein LOC127079143 n=1 Tax=Pisum sativum TaxID=3888 RepID=UPI0021CEA827|nr:uncharacterized protein LOC127079143 [Pisum sativum]